MLNQYAIGTGKLFDQLASTLDIGINELRVHGIEATTGRFRLGNVWYYTVEIKQGDSTKLPAIFSRILADHLAICWEKRQIENKIAAEYTYYDADEVEYLAVKASDFLIHYRRPGARDFRKKEIENEIEGYLREHAVLNIEGLLCFRLRDYQADIICAIERVIDDYLMDREHQEFVKLLRYFLQTQQSKTPKIHLIVGNNWVKMIDHEGLPITDDDLREFTEDLIDNDIQQDDIIISTLITLAPKIVHIHMTGEITADQILVDTVIRIFEERVLICNDCTLCKTPVTFWDRIAMIPLDYLK